VLPNNNVSQRLMAHAGIRLTRNYGVLDGEAALKLLEPPRIDRGEVLSLARRHHRAAGRRPCPEASMPAPEPA
jgi:hypothetical protein